MDLDGVRAYGTAGRFECVTPERVLRFTQNLIFRAVDGPKTADHRSAASSAGVRPWQDFVWRKRAFALERPEVADVDQNTCDIEDLPAQ